MAGTYTWSASYSGDGNNNAVSDGSAGNGGADGGQPGQPDDHHHAQPDQRHAGHHAR